MPYTIETIYAHDFGFADVQPPISAKFADGGTQPVEQSIYEAALSSGLTEEQADTAKSELDAALEGASVAEGRAIIEATFQQIGGHALKWLK